MRTYCRKFLQMFFLHQKYNDVPQIESRSLMHVISHLIGNDQNREEGIFCINVFIFDDHVTRQYI